MGNSAFRDFIKAYKVKCPVSAKQLKRDTIVRFKEKVNPIIYDLLKPSPLKKKSIFVKKFEIEINAWED